MTVPVIIPVSNRAYLISPALDSIVAQTRGVSEVMSSTTVLPLVRRFFRNMQRLYSEEKLFTSPLADTSGVATCQKRLHDDILRFCRDELLQFISEEIFFPCEKTLRLGL